MSMSLAVSRCGNPRSAADWLATSAKSAGVSHGQRIGEINRTLHGNPRIARPSAKPAPVAPAAAQ